MHLNKTRNYTESKIQNTLSKKSHWKNRGLEKSVEKMQARGRTCFLATHKKHHSLKTKKTCPKNATANETHKTQPLPQNTNPHHVMMIRGVDPHPWRHSGTLKPLHGGELHLTNGNDKYPTVNTQNATMHYE